MGEVYVRDSPVEVTKSEDTYWDFDFTRRIGQAQSISGADATIIQDSTGVDLISPIPTVTPISPIVRVQVDWNDTPDLAPGFYTLAVRAIIGSSVHEARLRFKLL